MDKINILWADDEIDQLKSQIIFLEERGYDLTTVTNGQDAIDKCTNEEIDLVFLDEHMPGLSGLETLSHIKEKFPHMPVVMITKNEEENIMDEALGGQIADYLIKPVKPKQILLTIKKLMDNKRLVSERNTADYQQEFQKIFSAFSSDLDPDSWRELYEKVVFWEMKLGASEDGSMEEVLQMQKEEANVEFFKFLSNNYGSWLNDPENAPVMSHNLMQKKVFPLLEKGIPTFFILIDNLRLDQWKTIQPIFLQHFRLTSDESYYGILPTSTQYSRNAIFSGLMPSVIEKRFPNYWKNDIDEGGKNMFENELLGEQIREEGLDIKHEYIKVTNHQLGKSLVDNILNMIHNDLNVIVYNFVDMLSHARTELEVLKELAGDEAAYRSLTLSWIEHSPLMDALKKLADKPVKLVVSTDHGSIRVKQPSKIIGDRNTTTNLRYKQGKNLNFNKKDVLEFKNPEEFGLPKQNISSSYVFAREDKFFVYPNNYNHYVNFYQDTFQHGGISLEEVIVPVATLTNK